MACRYKRIILHFKNSKKHTKYHKLKFKNQLTHGIIYFTTFPHLSEAFTHILPDCQHPVAATLRSQCMFYHILPDCRDPVAAE